jgi:hypothetical protein
MAIPPASNACSCRSSTSPPRPWSSSSWAVENDLIAASSHHDLVILRCQRGVVAGLPIPASERVSRLLGRLECSTLVISDPLRS